MNIRVITRTGFLLPILSLLFLVVTTTAIFAQTATPTPTGTQSVTSNDEKKKKEEEIRQLEEKVKELRTQTKTLSSQIAVMDSQIKLTQLRINATKAEIAELSADIETASKKINNLEHSLTNLTRVLVNRIIATYQTGDIQPLQILMSSGGVSDYMRRANYLKLVQEHDKQLVYDTQQAKMDYANQKKIFEDKKAKVESLKQELEGYTKKLDEDKVAKQSLLSTTQNDERRYQELLARARAEFEAIQGIIAGNGKETESGTVNQGDKIATIIGGPSCNSSGAHLHFIVSRNGSTENPFSYLKPVDHKNCSGSGGCTEADSFNPSGSWNWPLDGTITMNQGYGVTWFVSTYGWYNFHNGIDIVSDSYDVHAVKSGTLYKGSYTGFNGCRLPYVRVHHSDDGLDTFYLHVYY